MSIAMYLSYSSTLEKFEQIIFEYIKLNNLSSIQIVRFKISSDCVIFNKMNDKFMNALNF